VFQLNLHCCVLVENKERKIYLKLKLGISKIRWLYFPYKLAPENYPFFKRPIAVTEFDTCLQYCNKWCAYWYRIMSLGQWLMLLVVISGVQKFATALTTTLGSVLHPLHNHQVKSVLYLQEQSLIDGTKIYFDWTGDWMLSVWSCNKVWENCIFLSLAQSSETYKLHSAKYIT
jgi:hypothetical protein